VIAERVFCLVFGDCPAYHIKTLSKF